MHSKYSRACSKELDIPNMAKYAKIKGVNLMATGDFQHPKWQQELKENLSAENIALSALNRMTSTGYPMMVLGGATSLATGENLLKRGGSRHSSQATSVMEQIPTIDLMNRILKIVPDIYGVSTGNKDIDDLLKNLKGLTPNTIPQKVLYERLGD